MRLARRSLATSDLDASVKIITYLNITQLKTVYYFINSKKLIYNLIIIRFLTGMVFSCLNKNFIFLVIFFFFLRRGVQAIIRFHDANRMRFVNYDLATHVIAYTNLTYVNGKGMYYTIISRVKSCIHNTCV